MSATFPDIENHWTQPSITQLSQRSLVEGYPDGSFQPERAISRAEFAALIHRISPNLDHLDIIRDSIQFKDVPADHWTSFAIQFAYQRGFLAGYPGQLFKPDAPMPRAQAIVAMASGLRYPVPEQRDTLLTQYFEDASEIPDYAVDAIASATQQRLVVNYPQVRQLRPNQAITRGELATLLCRALRIYSVPDAYIVPVPPSATDADNHVAISPEFSNIDAFSEGLAKVSYGDNKYGFIDPEGTLKISLDTYPYTDFSEGLAAVKVRDKIGYIDKTGEMVIQPQFVEAKPFQAGRAIVAIKTPDSVREKYGYINRSGEFIIEPQFRQAGPFEDGLARVEQRVDGLFEYGFINTAGEMVIRLPRGVSYFHEGLAYFQADNGKYGYIDQTGTVVIQPQFEGADPFSEGRAWVYTKSTTPLGGRRLCIDRSGHVINPTLFERVDAFVDGRARACVDGQCGYLNRDGEFSLEFNDIRPFSEELAAVRIGDKQGFINRDHTLVIPAQYDVVYDRYHRLPSTCDFSEDRALVFQAGKYGYIDHAGDLVIAPQFDWALPFSEGLAAVRAGDEEYYIDKNGDIAFYSQFPRSRMGRNTPLPSFVNGLAVMEVDGWFGYIDNTGRSVIPAQFSQIRTRSDGFIQVNLGSQLVCRESAGDFPLNRCRYQGGKWGLLQPNIA